MSKHTKASRRAAFRRWARGWWFSTGSDIVANRPAYLTSLKGASLWSMELLLFGRTMIPAALAAKGSATPGHVSAALHAEFFEKHRVAFRTALTGEWVEARAAQAAEGAGV